MAGSPKKHSGTLTLGDALEFLRRRRAAFLTITTTILLGSILLAYKLPSVYLSEATILIEQPAIMDDIVQSTRKIYVDEQIQVVSQRVLTAENILSMVDELDVFVVESKTVVQESLVQMFRENTFLENRTTDIFDPRRGRVSGSTFAFVIGFTSHDPIIAQKVTDRLAALYLQENKRSRREQAQETTTFLEQEASRLIEDIAAIEERLANYKEEFSNALPNQTIFNTQNLDRRRRDVETLGQELIVQRSKRDQLKAQLGAMNPFTLFYTESGLPMTSSEDRLALLQQEYMKLTGRYGADHPDVVRVRREIEALSAGGSLEIRASEIAVQLAALERQRSQLLERYSSQHPDVVSLEGSIAGLRAEVARTNLLPIIPRRPTNPGYLQAQLQIAALEESLRSGQARRIQLQQEVDKLERNIAIAPRVEQEWLAINRGYETAISEYNAIKRRSTQARLSERIEAESKGQKFTILEYAYLPSDPIEPNRAAIIFLGTVLAFGAGIGFAALIDSMDPTVQGVSDLSELLETNPIATIPIIDSDQNHHWWNFRKQSVATNT